MWDDICCCLATEKCQHRDGCSHTAHKVNVQFCVSGKTADQIPAATANTSALYWVVFVEAKTNKGNQVTCKPASLAFSLCHWALKQGTTGLAGNKGWMSINVLMHARIHLRMHARAHKYSQRLLSETHTVQDAT